MCKNLLFELGNTFIKFDKVIFYRQYYNSHLIITWIVISDFLLLAFQIDPVFKSTLQLNTSSCILPRFCLL